MINEENVSIVLKSIDDTFAQRVPISERNVADRNPGQDLDDVVYFVSNDLNTADFSDVLLHGAYALPYFSLEAIRSLLPVMLSISISKKFQYQPALDSIVMGAADTNYGWGRHIVDITHAERISIILWMKALRTTDRYDSHHIDLAIDALNFG